MAVGTVYCLSKVKHQHSVYFIPKLRGDLLGSDTTCCRRFKFFNSL